MLKFDHWKGKEQEVVKFVKIASIVIVLFVLGSFIQFWTSNDISLKYESVVDFKVTKIKRIKGFLILNDSVGLSGSTPLIKETSQMHILRSLSKLPNDSYEKFKMSFDQLTVPFKVSKAKNSDTIIVYQATDTLYFKLLVD